MEEEKEISFQDKILNLKCVNVTCDTISVTCDKATWDCAYYIFEVTPGIKLRYTSTEPQIIIPDLKPKTEYCIKVRAVTKKNDKKIWSDPIRVMTERRFIDCHWDKCPFHCKNENKYILDERNP